MKLYRVKRRSGRVEEAIVLAKDARGARVLVSLKHGLEDATVEEVALGTRRSRILMARERRRR